MEYDPSSRDLNKRRLRQFLSDRFTGEGEIPPCQICGGMEFAIGDTVEAALESNQLLSHKYIPVDCTMCGHTLLFSDARIPKPTAIDSSATEPQA